MAQGAFSRQKIRILDFDASLLSQKKLLQKFSNPAYNLEIIGLQDIAPHVRYWINKKYILEFKKRIGPSAKNIITLCGSGDFHHLTALFLRDFQSPLSVISFDYHPDWDALSFCLNCGSWVNNAVAQKNIAKVLLLGPCSEDLSWRGLITASFKGINNKKLEIYPYRRGPSAVFLRSLKDNACFKLKRGLFGSKIQWTNLADNDLNAFLPRLLERLPTDDVYVSIDKDCLLPEYAFSNWEEGAIELDWLLAALKIIKEKKNIIGLDITGEYSPAILKGRIKNLVSRLDHPPQKVLPQAIDTVNAVNEATNLKILDVLIN